MLRLLLSLLLMNFFLVSCQDKNEKEDHQQTVTNYFAELNKSDLKKASAYVTDEIIVSEGDFIQADSKPEWFTQFQWDSVFSPVYKIIEMKEVDGKIEATISKECKRIQFLQDTAIIIKEVFEFKDEKISKEHTNDYLVFDSDKWQSRRDSLVAWTSKNHPEVPHFIYDQTISGGINYKTAIDLYERER